MKSYCYHFTKFKNLTSIFEKGLILVNGENCKLVGDSRNGICVSCGIEGTVVFSARYWYKMMYLYNDETIAREHFADSVFLRFEADNLNQESIVVENFSQIFSKSVISPDCLRVCYLQHINGNIEIDRFKIMLYMMKTIQFPNQIDLEDFPYKALIKKIYEDLKEDLENFKEKEYQLLDMPLSNLINQSFASFSSSVKK